VFGAAPFTTNSILGAVFNAANPATMTPPATGTWTEHDDVGYNTPATGMETVTLDSGFTSTTVTWGSSCASAFAAFAVEFDASTLEIPQVMYARTRY
jgi:hypothetical protein